MKIKVERIIALLVIAAGLFFIYVAVQLSQICNTTSIC